MKEKVYQEYYAAVKNAFRDPSVAGLTKELRQAKLDDLLLVGLEKGSPEVVLAQLQLGSNPNFVPEGGNPPIQSLIENFLNDSDFILLIDAFIRAGYDLETRVSAQTSSSSIQPMTLLQIAAAMGNQELSIRLVEVHHANLFPGGVLSEAPDSLAERTRHEDLARYFRKKIGETKHPLTVVWAALHGQGKMLRSLVGRDPELLKVIAGRENFLPDFIQQIVEERRKGTEGGYRAEIFSDVLDFLMEKKVIRFNGSNLVTDSSNFSIPEQELAGVLQGLGFSTTMLERYGIGAGDAEDVNDWRRQKRTLGDVAHDYGRKQLALPDRSRSDGAANAALYFALPVLLILLVYYIGRYISKSYRKYQREQRFCAAIEGALKKVNGAHDFAKLLLKGVLHSDTHAFLSANPELNLSVLLRGALIIAIRKNLPDHLRSFVTVSEGEFCFPVNFSINTAKLRLDILQKHYECVPELIADSIVKELINLIAVCAVKCLSGTREFLEWKKQQVTTGKMVEQAEQEQQLLTNIKDIRDRIGASVCHAQAWLQQAEGFVTALIAAGTDEEIKKYLDRRLPNVQGEWIDFLAGLRATIAQEHKRAVDDLVPIEAKVRQCYAAKTVGAVSDDAYEKLKAESYKVEAAFNVANSSVRDSCAIRQKKITDFVEASRKDGALWLSLYKRLAELQQGFNAQQRDLEENLENEKAELMRAAREETDTAKYNGLILRYEKFGHSKELLALKEKIDSRLVELSDILKGQDGTRSYSLKDWESGVDAEIARPMDRLFRLLASERKALGEQCKQLLPRKKAQPKEPKEPAAAGPAVAKKEPGKAGGKGKGRALDVGVAGGGAMQYGSARFFASRGAAAAEIPEKPKIDAAKIFRQEGIPLILYQQTKKGLSRVICDWGIFYRLLRTSQLLAHFPGDGRVQKLRDAAMRIRNNIMHDPRWFLENAKGYAEFFLKERIDGQFSGRSIEDIIQTVQPGKAQAELGEVADILGAHPMCTHSSGESSDTKEFAARIIFALEAMRNFSFKDRGAVGGTQEQYIAGQVAHFGAFYGAMVVIGESLQQLHRLKSQSARNILSAFGLTIARKDGNLQCMAAGSADGAAFAEFLLHCFTARGDIGHEIKMETEKFLQPEQLLDAVQFTACGLRLDEARRRLRLDRFEPGVAVAGPA